MRTLSDLFAQLGLPSDEPAIDAFIARHRAQCLGHPLAQAPVWSPSQCSFLREAVAEDSEWALPADALMARLCRP